MRHDTDLSRLGPRARFLPDIPVDPVFWLWPHRFPIGKLSLLVGDPGVGKSLLTADLAARVSAELPWPDAGRLPPPFVPPGIDMRNYLTGYDGAVLFVSPEDCPGSVLRPRLEAAGARLAYICFLDGVAEPALRLSPGTRHLPPLNDLPERPTLPLSLPDHLPALARAVRDLSAPRLVVLDPLHALLSPAAQAGSDALLRTLAGLAEIAALRSVAIVAVVHLSKARSSRMLHRVRGALTLIAAARCAHLLATDPHHPSDRILVPLKTIDGPPPPPIGFSIAPGPRLVWKDLTGTLPVDPDLFDLAPEPRSALCEACDWLSAFLATGDRPAVEVLRAACAAGIAQNTLRRAKRLLAVPSKQVESNFWVWSNHSKDR